MHVRNRERSLINLAKRTAATLLRLVPGSRALRLKRDLRDSAWLSEADAVIVSYPKSGRTFIRAMLARVYQRRFGIDERTLLEFAQLRRAPSSVPRILFTHAGDAMRKSEEICLNPTDYDGRRIVLIARHPGDIAVSRFYHLKHRSRDKARQRLAKQPLQSFVWAKEGGISSIVSFLNQFAALPGVTILRYEDFLAEPANALKALVTAIGLETDDEDIADAVQFGSLSNLKEREREGYFRSTRLRRTRKGDERSAKVRSGKSGGFRTQLPTDEADRIEEYVSAHLDQRFGYTSS